MRKFSLINRNTFKISLLQKCIEHYFTTEMHLKLVYKRNALKISKKSFLPNEMH